MEIYAPKYYKKFKCIADKCHHSCCIDWEIDIDDKTYEKYRSLDSEYGKNILMNIEESDGGRYFKLTECGRCPNLDDRGLCKIIINLSEDYLSDICRLHPRFINETGGKRELGLGLACEEALRIILSENTRFELVKIGDDGEKSTGSTGFNPIPERDFLIEYIQSTDIPLSAKLREIEKRYSLKTDMYSEREWLELLLSLEILDFSWVSVIKNALVEDNSNDISSFDKYLENFLVYIIYRHVSVANSYENLLARVGFSLASLKIIKYIASCEKNLTEKKLFDIIRLYSSEIEYSEENTAALIFEFESVI